MSSALQTFQEILNAKGLMPSELIADGNLHRCPKRIVQLISDISQWRIGKYETVILPGHVGRRNRGRLPLQIPLG